MNVTKIKRTETIPEAQNTMSKKRGKGKKEKQDKFTVKVLAEKGEQKKNIILTNGRGLWQKRERIEIKKYDAINERMKINRSMSTIHTE